MDHRIESNHGLTRHGGRPREARRTARGGELQGYAFEGCTVSTCDGSMLSGTGSPSR
jgi:hypothetical protein